MKNGNEGLVSLDGLVGLREFTRRKLFIKEKNKIILPHR